MPYTVTATPFGYRSTVVAPFPPEEARPWFEEIKRAVGPTPHPFGQLIDARGQKVQDPASVPIVEDAQNWVRAHGMQRSAVVVASAVVKMNLTRMSRETGMLTHERYFDGAGDPDWEAKALAWVTDGVEPA